MPYRPRIVYEYKDGLEMATDPEQGAYRCRLGGKSCLAGDVFGEYGFAAPLRIGQRLLLQDMAIYSMVKTTTFNGLRLPSIAIWDSETDQRRVTRTFGYEDFRSRL